MTRESRRAARGTDRSLEPRHARRSRRAVLAAAGTLAVGSLAGCLGDGAPTEADDPWLTRAELSDPPGVEGRLRLRKGQYWSYPLSGEEVFHLRYRVRSRLSLSFDAVTFPGEEFDAYRAGEDAATHSVASREGVPATTLQSRMPPGEYTFVIDNTPFGVSRSFDEVTVAVRLQVVHD